jgi:hypothetical protein
MRMLEGQTPRAEQVFQSLFLLETGTFDVLPASVRSSSPTLADDSDGQRNCQKTIEAHYRAEGRNCHGKHSTTRESEQAPGEF